MKAPKFPKIKHLPWSKAIARDDKYITSIVEDTELKNWNIYITEKMDGSNVCMTKDSLFARSHGHEPKHKSFDMLKKMYNEDIKYKIKDRMAIYGEWLYAKHSIKYNKLPSYLLVFDILDMKDNWWVDYGVVIEICKELDLEHVPIINEGMWNDRIKNMEPEGNSKYGNTREGYVIRAGPPFKYKDYDKFVAKAVRENHVQTDDHWKSGSIERNTIDDING